MIGLTTALLLHATLMAPAANTYTVAHERTASTGEPLVVLVGADWCPACVQMKSNVIPQAQRQGLLRSVAFAVVNTDQEPALARKLMRGGSIPQLIMFEKSDDGWKRKQLTGAQSVESLSSFLPKTQPASTKVTHAPGTSNTVER